jgi:hypothetical protein
MRSIVVVIALCAAAQADPRLGVDVDVHVEPGQGPPVVTVTTPPVAVQPAPAPAVIAVVPDVDRVRAQKTLLEVGPSLSNASYGIEAELAIPVTPSMRLGVVAGINHMFESFAAEEPGDMLANAGLELRWVGAGTRHFDFGIGGGVAKDSYDTGGYGSLRFSYVREYERTGLSFSVEPLALFDFLGQWSSVAIAVMGSVRVEIPL